MSCLNSQKVAPVAQLVEHLTLNQGVQGSNPCGCTNSKSEYKRVGDYQLFCFYGFFHLNTYKISGAIYHLIYNMAPFCNSFTMSKLKHLKNSIKICSKHQQYPLKQIMIILVSWKATPQAWKAALETRKATQPERM